MRLISSSWGLILLLKQFSSHLYNEISLDLNSKYQLLIQQRPMLHNFQLGVSPNPNPNTDLALIKTYLRNEFQPQFHLRNINDLSCILRNRLQHSNHTKEERQRCRDWMALHKVDIYPTLDLIRQQKRKKEEEERANPRVQNRVVVQPTLMEQERFVQRSIDYSMNGMLHFAATGRPTRRNVYATLMKRLNIGVDNGGSRQFRINYAKVAVNEQKRKKYLELTVDLIKRRNDESGFEMKEWAMMLMQNIDHHLWRVIYSQVKRTTDLMVEGPRDYLMKNLLISSLLAMQGEFDEELPRSNEGIASYLEKKYLSRVDEPGEYLMDAQLGCVWGKAFLYFRAGRYKELSKLLERHGMPPLKQQIEDSTAFLKDYNPQKLDVDSNYKQKDIFRQQILYAIRGERKYSSDAISSQHSLDSIWILLRNTGIYYDTDQRMFQEMREQMVEFYKRNCSPHEIVYFLAYLLDYDELARLGENEALDKDDYVHLLILLDYYRFLTVDEKMIRLKLTENLISYLLELTRQGSSPYLEYYLSLIPQEMLLTDGPAIIVSNKFYPIINWQTMSEVLKGSDFIPLLKRSTELYVKESGNYLEGAETLMGWIHKQPVMLVEDISGAIDMLAMMLIKNANGSKIYPSEEIAMAIKLMEKWIAIDPNLERNNSSLLQLFQNDRKLAKYLIDRNHTQLCKFLDKERINTLFFTSIDFFRGRMFDKLIELQGMGVFFIFMRNIIKAGDLIFSFEERAGRSRDLRFQVLKMCRLIQEHEKYGQVMKEEGFQSLIAKLESEISNIVSIA